MFEIPISREMINRMLEAQGKEPITESDHEKYMKLTEVQNKYTDLIMEKIKEVIDEYAKECALEIVEIMEGGK